ncbi:MAG: DNA polymerase III subunit chi [Arhodomonas sp.]|nr:DNA polymerase III subunit chi [Arhodomonas sp.]
MQVDFYILGESGAEARERFACRLAEKAFREGFTVAVQVPDGPATARVDDLLWSFRQGSFVPHAPADQADDADPVVVGTEEGLAERQLLINLTDALPARLAGLRARRRNRYRR